MLENIVGQTHSTLIAIMGKSGAESSQGAHITKMTYHNGRLISSAFNCQISNAVQSLTILETGLAVSSQVQARSLCNSVHNQQILKYLEEIYFFLESF